MGFGDRLRRLDAGTDARHSYRLIWRIAAFTSVGYFLAGLLADRGLAVSGLLAVAVGLSVALGAGLFTWFHYEMRRTDRRRPEDG